MFKDNINIFCVRARNTCVSPSVKNNYTLSEYLMYSPAGAVRVRTCEVSHEGEQQQGEQRQADGGQSPAAAVPTLLLQLVTLRRVGRRRHVVAQVVPGRRVDGHHQRHHGLSRSTLLTAVHHQPDGHTNRHTHIHRHDVRTPPSGTRHCPGRSTRYPKCADRLSIGGGVAPDAAADVNDSTGADGRATCGFKPCPE